MKNLHFSFIIPVFNRPEEVKELLGSFIELEGDFDFEVVIVEDGSTQTSEHLVEQFKDQLRISYYFKENSGPGDSRNYGMRKAKGNYFIILDSDCLLPKSYLKVVKNHLKDKYTDCYGGPDAAHESFTRLQKAINFAMTSFMTTGGIRGGKNSVDKFQPRSFNMGLSKEAFEKSGGFGRIHPGEDPDLSIRLNDLGYKSQLIENAFVYHKRRISWSKFHAQVYKFGMVRPILNSWHPKTKRLTYWFPALFSLGLIFALFLSAFGYVWLLQIFGMYLLLTFVVAWIVSRDLVVGILSIIAVLIQFFGYGYGFLKSTLAIKLLGKQPEQQFPNLFFKHVE
ncbi:cellulose synthase/poly-beta-1,6-N-acetylglucosamine synthase-like glycosyltransferase [Flavobacteriaceae bacterium MAR_2010_72]|nr:cellulose synthase/poly-beta-1,6-N-acetylglucosamine synthase-like glycosyltransferase [Flavobacteriaceae bacterium MAR_2010_72]